MPGMGFGFGFGFNRRASGSSASASEQLLTLATDDGWNFLYDLTNSTTLTTREDGGTLFVSAVGDGLGNRPDMQQPTAAAQPELNVGAFGKIDGWIGDGSSKYLVAASAFNLAQPAHYIMVSRRDTASNTAMLSATTSGGRHQIYQKDSTGMKYAMFAGSEVLGSASDTLAHVTSSSFNGASSYRRIDGAQVLSGDVGANNLATPTWSGDGLISQFFNGPLALLIGFAGTPSDAVRDRMEDLVHDLTGIAKA